MAKQTKKPKKTWEGSLEQVRRIHSAVERITPPEPSDEFEELRAPILDRLDLMGTYIHGRVTGEGTMTEPREMEPER